MRFFDVENSLDYYSFGMLMPERFGGGDYRYSFQGQEADNEIKGKGNSVNYKYRMHDARLGRFFAVDPLASKYPHNSVYAFSENVVINAVELEGLERYTIHQRSFAPWEYFGYFYNIPINRANAKYHGDNRGYSTSESKTSRVKSQATIDIEKGVLIGTTASSDVSIAYDVKNKEIARKVGKPSFQVAGPKTVEDRVRVKTYLSGSNPLVPGAPPIYWSADISVYDHIDEGYVLVSSSVTGKGFPAYESFIEDENGTRIFINAIAAPEKSQFFTRLAGAPIQVSTPNIVTKIAVDSDGNFQGVYVTNSKGEEVVMSPKAYNESISSLNAATDPNE